MNVLRIEKREDGWWLANVTPGQADNASDTGYGPYRTRKQAEADQRGLELFFREHGGDAPTHEASLPQLPEPTAVKSSAPDQEAATTLACEPARLGRKKHIKSAPGQQLLPGFEPEEPGHA